MKKIWICDICGKEINRFNACEVLEIGLTSESGHEKIFEGNVCGDCLYKVKSIVDAETIKQCCQLALNRQILATDMAQPSYGTCTCTPKIPY